MESVSSYKDVQTRVKDIEKVLLLIYKSEHIESDCAYRNLESALKGKEAIPALTVDVNTVMDIHPNFGVTKVPSIVLFNHGKFEKVVEGCRNDDRYKALMTRIFGKDKADSKEKKPIEVVVYSTPTCGWCNSLKRWLQDNNVTYKEIDVSVDEEAARSLIQRTGHQGVPQIDINNQLIVGFNIPLIKELLGLSRN